MKKHQIIDNIIPGSIAAELGLISGDEVISINDTSVTDVLDYRFLCMDEYLDIYIKRGDEYGHFEVEKDEDEDLGIVFDNGLMDEYHTCKNKCIFCFIDQMPKNMRETLYVKDDDERLSFLQGNYITLTNLNDKEVDRIINYHLSPINISVHTMNRELRKKMLSNKHAGEVLDVLDKFYEAGISMNAQIVLCEGYNDGAELEYSIKELMKYAPILESVSVVPVGLTRYRDGLCNLQPISLKCANETIDIVEKYQKQCIEKYNIHFIHASDEFYLMTDREIPREDSYDGYPQLENGVGMVRMLHNEFNECLEYAKSSDIKLNLCLATGKINVKHLQQLIGNFNKIYPNINVDLIPITNEFFGENITVSGLLTGQDIIKQLKDCSKYDYLLISSSVLRYHENVLLDDITLDEISNKLSVKIITPSNDGSSLFDALCGVDSNCGRNHQKYEP